MTQNGEHKPTINGIIKGRPGKGRVLSLGQRKTCYAKPTHQMTEDNTFRYTPKPTKATPKPLERQWCKRCRAASRKRSVGKRLAAAKALAHQTRKEANGQLDAVLPKAEGKPRKTALDEAQARQSKARISGAVKVGCCSRTFPDAPTASKHVASGECQGKVTPKTRARKGKAAVAKAA